MSSTTEDVLSRLDHPVIDGDGHFLEYLPLVRDFIAEEAGNDVAANFEQMANGSALLRQVPEEKRRGAGLSRTAWWALPSKNTLDRATAMLPGLLYKRLDELGIDFAVIYPTYGLTVTALADAELRQAMARAFNRYASEAYADYRDRLEPVAAIPMFTPEEACAELDHAVGELGMKAIMMAGVIPRSIPGLEEHRAARYINGIGHDSEFDYEPVWQKCRELKVSPTFHAGGQGWGTRMSVNSYVYNHIGNFAAAGEGAARSLFLGGVPMRHKDLNFAFLEGGVAWGCNLYSDILGHFEKRNTGQIENYNPSNLDREELLGLFEKYAAPEVLERMDEIDLALLMLSDPGEDILKTDEFAESGVKTVQDIADIFSKQYYFGCEADDPMNAMAFNSSLNPGGICLKAIFASDIGHWDVVDMKEVLAEAWELVEDGHLNEEDFKAFTFGNALEFWGGNNPDFFENTSISKEAKKFLTNRD